MLTQAQKDGIAAIVAKWNATGILTANGGSKILDGCCDAMLSSGCMSDCVGEQDYDRLVKVIGVRSEDGEHGFDTSEQWDDWSELDDKVFAATGERLDYVAVHNEVGEIGADENEEVWEYISELLLDASE